MSHSNDKGHRANGAPQATTQDPHQNCAASGGGDEASITMQARATLCGCTQHDLPDGAYLVCRWNYGKAVRNYSEAVPCIRVVGDLLCQIGGR